MAARRQLDFLGWMEARYGIVDTATITPAIAESIYGWVQNCASEAETGGLQPNLLRGAVVIRVWAELYLRSRQNDASAQRNIAQEAM